MLERAMSTIKVIVVTVVNNEINESEDQKMIILTEIIFAGVASLI